MQNQDSAPPTASPPQPGTAATDTPRTPDLSTVSDADLYSEIGRRRGAKRVQKGGGGRPVGYRLSDEAKARIGEKNAGHHARRKAVPRTATEHTTP